VVEVRKIAGEGEILREVMVKIGLERIYTQKRTMVEALLDSKAIELVISSEFAKKKQKFKLKKIKRPIYMRNVDETFNKKELIKNTVKVNIFHQGYKERTKIDLISKQK